MVNIIKDGDLFTVPADILINPVNRMGISGAGLAKAFKKRFASYDQIWHKNKFPIPTNQIDFVGEQIGGGFRICYLATKHKPSDSHSDLELIKELLLVFKRGLNEEGFIGTINMPALGCGLGGLDFEGVVKPLIVDMFQNEPYTINLFEPK